MPPYLPIEHDGKALMVIWGRRDKMEIAIAIVIGVWMILSGVLATVAVFKSFDGSGSEVE